AKAEKDILDKRKKQVSYKKECFKNDIDGFFKNLSTNFYIDKAEAIDSFLQHELKKSSDAWDDKKKYQFISKLRTNVSDKWRELDKALKVTKPNVGLSNAARKEWESYLKNKAKLDEDVINPAKKKTEELLSRFISVNGLTFSARERVNEIVEEEKKSLNRVISNYRNELKEDVSKIESVVKEKAREKSSEYTQALAEVMTAINSTAIETYSSDESIAMISSWENTLDDINKQTESYFSKLRETVELGKMRISPRCEIIAT
ncbi:hypothetical protein, partial [Shewanella sp. Isolate7]|uniref:hypothetical protein n=1 Tax=Shewanella sp. Isolate7 TaxID=2908528 RepID=UPI001EFEB359